jgi:hypothetical protein
LGTFILLIYNNWKFYSVTMHYAMKLTGKWMKIFVASHFTNWGIPVQYKLLKSLSYEEIWLVSKNDNGNTFMAESHFPTSMAVTLAYIQESEFYIMLHLKVLHGWWLYRKLVHKHHVKNKLFDKLNRKR